MGTKLNSAIIIGGGLAGASAAHALLKRGLKVTLIERHDSLGVEASGNLSGILMPFLAQVPEERMRFSLAAFDYAQRLFKELPDIQLNANGVLRLTTSDRLRGVYERLSELNLSEEIVRGVDAQTASDIADTRIVETALYFPQGAALSPPKLCKALTAHENFTHRVDQALLIDATDARPRVILRTDTIEADLLVIANAADCQAFEQTAWIPLERVRGQVAHVPANETSTKLRCAVCYEGYVTPAENGVHLLGASYEHNDFRTELISEKQNVLLARAAERLPELKFAADVLYPGKVAFRAGTPDRLPAIGRVPIPSRLKDFYVPTRRNVIDVSPDSEIFHRSIFVSVGHGSNGLVSCPLAGEIIAALAFDEPLPLDAELLPFLNPSRFLVRELKRA